MRRLQCLRTVVVWGTTHKVARVSSRYYFIIQCSTCSLKLQISLTWLKCCFSILSCYGEPSNLIHVLKPFQTGMKIIGLYPDQKVKTSLDWLSQPFLCIVILYVDIDKSHKNIFNFQIRWYPPHPRELWGEEEYKLQWQIIDMLEILFKFSPLRSHLWMSIACSLAVH